MKIKAAAHEYYDTLESPVGRIYLLFSRSCLSGISFSPPELIPLRSNESTLKAREELSEYFKSCRRTFTFKTVFIEGTDFEKRVWKALLDIPYGETRSYKWIAEHIGDPHASRAVGNALGKNPIPIIFPCHRVIESDGGLGGYTPGVEIKRRLLGIEYYSESLEEHKKRG